MRASGEQAILESLGANVARRRARLHLTQEELAEAADLTPRFIQSVERAAVNPSVTVVVALAEALGTTTNGLLRSARLTKARAGRPPVRRPRRVLGRAKP